MREGATTGSRKDITIYAPLTKAVWAVGAVRALQAGAARAVMVRHAVAGRTRERNVVLADGSVSLIQRGVVAPEQTDHTMGLCEWLSPFAALPRGRAFGVLAAPSQCGSKL